MSAPAPKQIKVGKDTVLLGLDVEAIARQPGMNAQTFRVKVCAFRHRRTLALMQGEPMTDRQTLSADFALAFLEALEAP